MESPITKHVKFPLQYDIERLQADYDTAMLKFESLPHHNTGAYDGLWSTTPLFAIGGNVNSTYAYAHGEGEKFEGTEVLQHCPYFKEIMDSFKCEKQAVRILNLTAGSKIATHTDLESGYEDGICRMHIPIHTNEGVGFVLDDEVLRMKQGELWYVNTNLEHSVFNDGDADRIHIVIDLERNAWTDEMFFAEAPEESFREPDQPEMSAEDKSKMIAELKRMNSEAANEILRGMEA